MKLKLGRTINHRHQMLKNLAISILLYEKVTTTYAKAKAVKPLVDNAINIAKNNDLASRRQLLSIFLHNKNVVEKLLKDLGPRFEKDASGYLKTIKDKPRVGDNAPQVILMLKKSKFIVRETKKDNKENTVKKETIKDKKAISKVK